MSKLIKDWDELASIPNESNTHILTVDTQAGSGWLRAKEENHEPFDSNKDFLEQLPHKSVYLSTHTFYGSQYKISTQMLQTCGFDVELENWDK